MAVVEGGDRICLQGCNEEGTGGCLVRFTDRPDRVMLMTAGHYLLPRNARQGDEVDDIASVTSIGQLWTWTTLDGDVTADVALVWADPARVSPHIRDLGLLRGITNVEMGQPVFLCSRRGKIGMVVNFLSRDIEVGATGPARRAIPGRGAVPGWGPTRYVYRNQILCKPAVSIPGDSGSLVVDEAGRVAGLLVGGGEWTVVTPIAAILQHHDWGGGQLEILQSIPADAEPPPRAGGRGVAVTLVVNLSSLSGARRAMAEKIMARFAAVGYAIVHQVAAVANAIGESNLNPLAHATVGEDSVGLFQLNRNRGLGVGFSVELLQDPDTNVTIVLKALSRIPEFRQATSIDTAVDVFVRKLERPANPDAAVQKRLEIARSLLRTP